MPSNFDSSPTAGLFFSFAERFPAQGHTGKRKTAETAYLTHAEIMLDLEPKTEF